MTLVGKVRFPPGPERMGAEQGNITLKEYE
jgi:hypothetical protein